MNPFFVRDDAWQTAVATKFLTPLYWRRGYQVERYLGAHPMQRMHVDVTLRKDDEIVHHIDEKIIRGRRDGQRAEKVNLETWSRSVPNTAPGSFGWKRGWMATDEPNRATALLIGFADTPDIDADAWRKVEKLDCLWMPFAPLRAWFWEQGEERWEEQPNKQENNSISRKVPIADIEQALGIKRFTVTADPRNHYCYCGQWGYFGFPGDYWFCLKHKDDGEKYITTYVDAPF